MPNDYQFICSVCGYSKNIFSEQERYDKEDCPICGGKMNVQSQTSTDEPTGDNFPKLSDCPEDYGATCNKGKACDSCKDNSDIFQEKEIKLQEQELSNSVRTIGEAHSWCMIEAIADVKLRVRYRMLFFKLGCKMAIQEE